MGGKMRKSLNDVKEKGETTPKPGIQENTSNERAQMEKKKLIKCQKTKCHYDRYSYRTSECLELHERLQHQQGKQRVQVQEMKEKNYRAKFKLREHRCWGNPREDTCVNLYRATNEDAPEEEIEYVDENGKLYVSIFTFKENRPSSKKMNDRFKRRIICKEKECKGHELLTEECLG